MPALPPVKPGTKFSEFADEMLPNRALMRASLGVHVVNAMQPVPDTNDPVGMKTGAAKRFCMEPPPIDDEFLKGLESFVLRWVKKNLLPLDACSDTSVPTWLEKTNYTLARKSELLEKWKKNPDMNERRNRYVKMFLKDESYPEYKYPRGINSRVDEFKCATGPIFKLIEEQVFKLDWFIKKIPVSERPAYIQSRLGHGVKFIATDYSSFEALFRRKIMWAVERQLYLYMTSHLPDGASFMELFDTVISGKNEICNKYFKIYLEATRMSGEMNTSLGNGFSNLMFMLYLCEKKGAKDPLGVVEGDDGLFTMCGDHPTKEDFEKLGLIIKLEEHDSLSSASFCGLIFDPGDLINITDPLKVLCNSGWTTRQYAGSSHRRKMELLKCKALSIMYQYNGCPILMQYARWLLRVTRGFRARPGQSNLYDREKMLEALSSKLPSLKPGQGTRELMAEKFGITIDHQKRLEEYFDSLNTLCCVQHELVSMYAPSDWEHYYRHYVRVVDMKSKYLLEPSFGDTHTAGHEIRIVVSGEKKNAG